MGRSPCCSKESVNRGAWTATEDRILSEYIHTHGEGGRKCLPKKAGLNRCGKSCRLRWLNYLRPDIKSGNISTDEEELIIRMHRLLGNRWALIAGRIPGRTDNEIKNYWNSHLSKRLSKSGNIHRSGSSSSLENDQKVIKTSPIRITTAVRHSPTLEPNNGLNSNENTGSDSKCLEGFNEDYRPLTSPHTDQQWKLNNIVDEKDLPSLESMIENWNFISPFSDLEAERVCMEPHLEELCPFQLSSMEPMDASHQLKSIRQLLELEDQWNEEEEAVQNFPIEKF